MTDKRTDLVDKLHEYGLDFKNRRVFLQTPFWSDWDREDDGAAGHIDMVQRNLLFLDSIGSDPIELWISTPGGATEEMWSCVDIVQAAHCSIDTIAMGNVSSAGCLVLAAGTGTRYAMKHASFLWHGGEMGAQLSPREFDQRAERYRQETKTWVEEMARLTHPKGYKQMPPKIKFWESKIHDTEFWLDAAGMVEHGVVDEIWTGNE